MKRIEFAINTVAGEAPAAVMPYIMSGESWLRLSGWGELPTIPADPVIIDLTAGTAENLDLSLVQVLGVQVLSETAQTIQVEINEVTVR